MIIVGYLGRPKMLFDPKCWIILDSLIKCQNFDGNEKSKKRGSKNSPTPEVSISEVSISCSQQPGVL